MFLFFILQTWWSWALNHLCLFEEVSTLRLNRSKPLLVLLRGASALTNGRTDASLRPLSFKDLEMNVETVLDLICALNLTPLLSSLKASLNARSDFSLNLLCRVTLIKIILPHFLYILHTFLLYIPNTLFTEVASLFRSFLWWWAPCLYS